MQPGIVAASGRNDFFVEEEPIVHLLQGGKGLLTAIAEQLPDELREGDDGELLVIRGGHPQFGLVGRIVPVALR